MRRSFERLAGLHDQIAETYREMADSGTEQAGDITADATRIAAGMAKDLWPVPTITQAEAEGFSGGHLAANYVCWCRRIAAYCAMKDYRMWPDWWADSETIAAYRGGVLFNSHAEYRFHPRWTQ